MVFFFIFIDNIDFLKFFNYSNPVFSSIITILLVLLIILLILDLAIILLLREIKLTTAELVKLRPVEIKSTEAKGYDEQELKVFKFYTIYGEMTVLINRNRDKWAIYKVEDISDIDYYVSCAFLELIINPPQPVLEGVNQGVILDPKNYISMEEIKDEYKNTPPFCDLLDEKSEKGNALKAKMLDDFKLRYFGYDGQLMNDTLSRAFEDKPPYANPFKMHENGALGYFSVARRIFTPMKELILPAVYMKARRHLHSLNVYEKLEILIKRVLYKDKERKNMIRFIGNGEKSIINLAPDSTRFSREWYKEYRLDLTPWDRIFEMKKDIKLYLKERADYIAQAAKIINEIIQLPQFGPRIFEYIKDPYINILFTNANDLPFDLVKEIRSYPILDDALTSFSFFVDEAGNEVRCNGDYRDEVVIQYQLSLLRLLKERTLKGLPVNIPLLKKELFWYSDRGKSRATLFQYVDLDAKLNDLGQWDYPKSRPTRLSIPEEKNTEEKSS